MIYVLYLNEENNLAISEKASAPTDRPRLFRTATHTGACTQRRYYQSLINSGKLSMSDIEKGRIPD